MGHVTRHQEHRKMHRQTRRRALTLAASVLTTAGLAAPASSHGATYLIQQCNSQTGHQVSGMVGSAQGPNSFSNAACGSGARNLGGAFSSASEHVQGDFAQARFTAPSGTSLDFLVAQRTASAGQARANGAPVARLTSVPGGIRETFAAVAGANPSASGQLSVGLDGDSSVAWGAYCDGPAGCPAGETFYLLEGLFIGLRDSHVPVLSNVAGPLRSSSERTQTRSLTYSASDTGGGVFRQRLVIDGTPRAAEVVDTNAGKCAQPFGHSVPCKTEVAGSVSLDTGSLSDGAHEIALDVRDATDENKALHGPWTITVDNNPPSVGAPELTGNARDGDTLTCSGAVNGQAANVTFQWIRANTDGGQRFEIPGATNAAYTMHGEDVGKKLICRVTATDGGGSTTRETTITQAPFDGGKLVATYCTDRPSGPADECGDLDGDQRVNREDDDVDGDGVPNISDESPYDASRPGAGAPPSSGGGSSTNTSTTNTTTTTTSNTNSSSNSNTSGDAGPPAPGTAGTVKFLLGRDTATFIGRQSKWLRSSFTLRGRLTGLDGRGLAGLKLFVSQSAAGKTISLGSTTTNADGNWSFRMPRGPGRTITVTAGDGVNAATMTVRQRVTAHVTLRALRKRIGSGGLAQFRGQLRGGHVNTREKLVEFQVYYRRSWRTIGTLRVNRQGRFSVKYRFGTAAYGRYKFRARTMPTDGYPFAVGTSSTRASTVRVG